MMMTIHDRLYGKYDDDADNDEDDDDVDNNADDGDDDEDHEDEDLDVKAVQMALWEQENRVAPHPSCLEHNTKQSS